MIGVLAGEPAACARGGHQVRDRDCPLAAHHVAELLGLVHQLVEGHEEEGVDLVFDDRPHARHGRAGGEAGEARLGNGRVVDPVGAEFLEEPLRHAAHAHADVLPEDDDFGIAPHLLSQRFAERFQVANLSHGCALSLYQPRAGRPGYGTAYMPSRASSASGNALWRAKATASFSSTSTSASTMAGSTPC